jgi:hypothetical protein
MGSNGSLLSPSIFTYSVRLLCPPSFPSRFISGSRSMYFPRLSSLQMSRRPQTPWPPTTSSRLPSLLMQTPRLFPQEIFKLPQGTSRTLSSSATRIQMPALPPHLVSNARCPQLPNSSFLSVHQGSSRKFPLEWARVKPDTQGSRSGIFFFHVLVIRCVLLSLSMYLLLAISPSILLAPPISPHIVKHSPVRCNWGVNC